MKKTMPLILSGGSDMVVINHEYDDTPLTAKQIAEGERQWGIEKWRMATEEMGMPPAEATIAMTWTDDDFIAQHTLHMARLEHEHKLGLMCGMLQDVRTDAVIREMMERGRAKEL